MGAKLRSRLKKISTKTRDGVETRAGRESAATDGGGSLLNSDNSVFPFFPHYQKTFLKMIALISLLPVLLQSPLVTSLTIPTSYPDKGTNMADWSLGGVPNRTEFQQILNFYSSDPRLATITRDECLERYWVSYSWPFGWMSKWETRPIWGANSMYRYGCFLYILSDNPAPERDEECNPNMASLGCLAKRNLFWELTLDLFAPLKFRLPTKAFLWTTYIGFDASGTLAFGLFWENLIRDVTNIDNPMTHFDLLVSSLIVTPIMKHRYPPTFQEFIYIVATGSLKVTKLPRAEVEDYISKAVNAPAHLTKRQSSSTVGTTDIMLQYCKLNAINANPTNNQEILVGCLGGIARFCSTVDTQEKLLECQKYYNTVYGASTFAPIVQKCPKWIHPNATTSDPCNTAVNGFCKATDEPSVCGFSKLSQQYIFADERLAPFRTVTVIRK